MTHRSVIICWEWENVARSQLYLKKGKGPRSVPRHDQPFISLRNKLTWNWTFWKCEFMYFPVCLSVLVTVDRNKNLEPLQKTGPLCFITLLYYILTTTSRPFNNVITLWSLNFNEVFQLFIINDNKMSRYTRWWDLNNLIRGDDSHSSSLQKQFYKIAYGHGLVWRK